MYGCQRRPRWEIKPFFCLCFIQTVTNLMTHPRTYINESNIFSDNKFDFLRQFLVVLRSYSTGKAGKFSHEIIQESWDHYDFINNWLLLFILEFLEVKLSDQFVKLTVGTIRIWINWGNIFSERSYIQAKFVLDVHIECLYEYFWKMRVWINENATQVFRERTRFVPSLRSIQLKMSSK